MRGELGEERAGVAGPRLRMLMVDKHVPRTVASVQPPKRSILWLIGSRAVAKPWLAEGSAPEVVNGVHVT